MGVGPALGITLLVLILLVLSGTPPSWGQASNRIGTVLAVKGNAVVQTTKSAGWNPLRFRDALFLQDKLRAKLQSKVKVLLRDDSIWTLLGQGEMEFSENAKPRCKWRGATPATQPKKGKIARLVAGKLRVSSARLTGAKTVAEVRTPNAVACMRGTDVIISYESGRSEITVLEGIVAVGSLRTAMAEVQEVLPNFRTQVVGSMAPAAAVKVEPTALQALKQELTVTEQVPAEVAPFNYEVATSEEEMRDMVQSQLKTYPSHAAEIIASAIALKPEYAKIITQTVLAFVPAEIVAEVIASAVGSAPEAISIIISSAISTVPGQTATVVGAAVEAAPMFAAEVVEAAITAAPGEAVNIAMVATETAPKEAANIVGAAVTAASDQAAAIVVAVVEVAPIFASQIVEAAVAAVTLIEEATTLEQTETVTTADTPPASTGGGGDPTTPPDDNRQPEDLITSPRPPASVFR